MELSNSNYCIILAGGRGKRLWPSSRSERPKQFIDFFGTGRTQLQATFDRMSTVVPKENIYVCTCKEYEHWVHEQLPELDDSCLMIEPVNRNTAASVAQGMLHIQQRNECASIAIVPSDQYVTGDDAFCRNMIYGLQLVSQQDMALVMGVKPTRPEPGYGYIQMGINGRFDSVYTVKSFVEKPEREFATMFMESGEFLWNTGIILCNATYLRKCLRQLFFEIFAPGICENNTYTVEQVIDFIERNYASLPNMAIDQGVLQQSENIYVMQVDFGWADLGTWHSIYEFMQKSKDDNVVIDSEVMMEDCKGNIIKLPKDHIGVINGLEGYIVAEEGDVLLICKKSDSSSLIRKYVNEAGIRYGEKYI
jgi:mannose-1-phosphate guanylyltransferase